MENGNWAETGWDVGVADVADIAPSNRKMGCSLAGNLYIAVVFVHIVSLTKNQQ